MSRRALIGLGFLLSVALVLGIAFSRLKGVGTLSGRFFDLCTGRLVEQVLHFDAEIPITAGDPVYSVENQGFAKQGVVTKVTKGTPTVVLVELDPTFQRRLGKTSKVVAMKPEWDLGWVVRTLVPPDLRSQILAELSVVWEKNSEGTLDALRPTALGLLGDVVSVLSKTLPGVAARHTPERDAFIAVFREEIFPKELEPELKTGVFSRLEARVGVLAASIGSEIWSAVAVSDILGILWTATKNSVGAGNKDEMAERLRSLVRDRALPVIGKRAPEVVDAALAALGESFRDPKVRGALDRAASKTLEHPAFQRYVGVMLDEWLVKNPELHATIREALGSRALRQPMADLYKAAEPILEKALEEVLTRTDRMGMDHQLVRVLRHLVLKKDQYYIVIAPDGPKLAPNTPLPGILGEDP